MKTFVDLFAGCGGLSLGFQKAGWRLKFAVEGHPDAFATYRENLVDRAASGVDWPEWLPREPHDIVALIKKHRRSLKSLAGTIELVAGGPPCQGFSTNGRRRKDDPRNQMVKSYLELVSILRPRMVLIENVRGFTSMPHDAETTFSEYVLKELEGLGYDTWTQLLTASDWGIPQRRPRFFLVAVQKGLLRGVDPFVRLRTLRRSFLSARGLPFERPVTAGEALEDLRLSGRTLRPDPEFGHLGFQCVDYQRSGKLSTFGVWARGRMRTAPSDMRLPQHTKRVAGRFSRILRTCPLGRSISPTDRKRLGIKKRSTTPMSPNLPSPTVTTLPDDMIHYAEPRILTVREHARLQSFPDWFKFKGPYTSGGARRKNACPRYTQVGNAVPPLLAEAVAEMLAGLLVPLAAQTRSQSANVLQVKS
ncbi:MULTISPECIES: DNA cytosine methyltransferase [Bradyrhizobium]|jgi:DNA (cytosine-5)-methyltransferase 1|nr:MULTISPECIES: DNA cytosine methyltransferase [Bradyrhizobium]MBK5653361.1 DNA cytosine methyltransferase [Rhizobium sp.]